MASKRRLSAQVLREAGRIPYWLCQRVAIGDAQRDVQNF